MIIDISHNIFFNLYLQDVKVFRMKNKLLYYAIPLLMLGIVINQLLQIPKGLTRWKGGGYGMYTDIHPDFRQVVINDSFIEIDTLSQNRKLFAAVKKYANFPQDKYKNEMVKQLNWKNDTLNIAIWQLFFDAETQILNKKIIHQDVHIKK